MWARTPFFIHRRTMDKVKVLMRDSVVGRDGAFKNRKTYEVTKEQAELWAKNGACVLVPRDAKPETAVLPRARRKATVQRNAEEC